MWVSERRGHGALGAQTQAGGWWGRGRGVRGQQLQMALKVSKKQFCFLSDGARQPDLKVVSRSRSGGGAGSASGPAPHCPPLVPLLCLSMVAAGQCSRLPSCPLLLPRALHCCPHPYTPSRLPGLPQGLLRVTACHPGSGQPGVARTRPGKATLLLPQCPLCARPHCLPLPGPSWVLWGTLCLLCHTGTAPAVTTLPP